MLGGSVGNKAGWVRDSVDLLVEEAGWECSQVEVGAVREKCISSVQQCLKVSEWCNLNIYSLITVLFSEDLFPYCSFVIFFSLIDKITL